MMPSKRCDNLLQRIGYSKLKIKTAFWAVFLCYLLLKLFTENQIESKRVGFA